MDAYKLNTNSMENMVAMISKNFNELKNSFATTLFPVISLVVEGVKNFMGWISALPSPIKFVVSGVSLLTSAYIALRATGILPIIADMGKLIATKYTSIRVHAIETQATIGMALANKQAIVSIKALALTKLTNLFPATLKNIVATGSLTTALKTLLIATKLRPCGYGIAGQARNDNTFLAPALLQSHA